MSALKWFCFDLRVLVRKLASPFGHPTQVSVQAQLAATCDYFATPFGQGFSQEKVGWGGRVGQELGSMVSGNSKKGEGGLSRRESRFFQGWGNQENFATLRNITKTTK